LRFEVLKVNASKQTENKNISGEGYGIFHFYMFFPETIKSIFKTTKKIVLGGYQSEGCQLPASQSEV
jgi:hypothetical protein